TSARIPAAPADQGETRRGANAIQRSAVSHQSTAPATSRDRPPGPAETRQASAGSAATRSTYAPRAPAAGAAQQPDPSPPPASGTPPRARLEPKTSSLISSGRRAPLEHSLASL